MQKGRLAWRERIYNDWGESVHDRGKLYIRPSESFSRIKSSGERLLHGKCLPRGDFFPVRILLGEIFPGGGAVLSSYDRTQAVTLV